MQSISDEVSEYFDKLQNLIKITIGTLSGKHLDEYITRLRQIERRVLVYSETKSTEINEALKIHRENVTQLRNMYIKHNLSINNLAPSKRAELDEKSYTQFKIYVDSELDKCKDFITGILKKFLRDVKEDEARRIASNSGAGTSSEIITEPTDASEFRETAEAKERRLREEEKNAIARQSAIDRKRKEIQRELSKNADNISELVSLLKLGDEEFAKKFEL